ncbi:alpha/beta hydrolase family protein [Nocardia sp. CDC160]|uniref:alpha/beta hydrolase family protein n=1 Tax=Nocardia sp. CDC160 TaxID=3112166 RepID=UPI002DBF5610|nr:hypothetical protein [Nocardia sp. CDC160]MEC3919871.1 hypothetical protein [Nocardia sp. CDC160]
MEIGSITTTHGTRARHALGARAHRRRPIAALAMGVLLLGGAVLTACAPDPVSSAAPSVDRGRLVRSEPLRTLSPEQLTAVLADAGFDTGTARFGADTYRLTYDTVDPSGSATTATGLLALPATPDHDLTAVLFEHGTMATKADAPSVAEHGGDLAATLTFAGAGFAGIAPDYLGLGLGPGQHPYLDLPSETTASVDMLRAARDFVNTTGRQLRPGVDLTGFSQGGPAALGVARNLGGTATDTFHTAAAAPISGPYDIRETELPALLAGELDPTSAVFYSGYFLTAWNRLHQLYDSPGEVFRAPYDSTVEQLFDGTRTEQQIVENLPENVDLLLTPHGLDLLRHPSDRLAAALRTADEVCRTGTPRVPIRLYTGSEDRDVVPGNSVRCREYLGAQGVDATTVDVGPVDHSGSGKAGIAAAVRWFQELTAPR